MTNTTKEKLEAVEAQLTSWENEQTYSKPLSDGPNHDRLIAAVRGLANAWHRVKNLAGINAIEPQFSENDQYRSLIQRGSLIESRPPALRRLTANARP